MIANPTLQGGGGKTHKLTVGGQRFDFESGMTWADVAENYPESFQINGDKIVYRQASIFYPGGLSPVRTVDLVANIVYVAKASGGGMD